MLARVCYDALLDIKSMHLGWTIQTSNVSQLPQDKRVFQTASGAFGSKVLFRSEKRNMSCMKYIIRKFTLSYSLVLDCYDSMFLVARACMLLPRHMQFVRFDLDSECVTSSLPQSSLLFARQVLNKRSALTKNDTVQ